MTLHKGKGLEFPQVFLPAWEAGCFPPDYCDLAEERWLAYVAITRGMGRVTISHSAFRRGPARPSCFLDDVPYGDRVLGWLRGPTEYTPRCAAPIQVDQVAVAHLPRRM